MRPRPTSPTLLWSPPWQWCPAGAEGTAIMGTQSFFVVLSILLTAGVRRPRNLPEVMGKCLPAFAELCHHLVPGASTVLRRTWCEGPSAPEPVGDPAVQSLGPAFGTYALPRSPPLPNVLCIPLRSYSSVNTLSSLYCPSRAHRPPSPRLPRSAMSPGQS